MAAILARSMAGAKGGNSMTNGILIVLTLGADEFSNFVTFECPCDDELKGLYSSCYLFGPALFLFMIAIVKQNMFWRMITGALRRKGSVFGGTGSDYAKGSMKWFQVIVTALPAAACWMLITLLKGEVYACGHWPKAGELCNDNVTYYVSPCEIPKTIDSSMTSCNAKMARDLKATSHMIGWAGITGMGVVILVAFSLKKALSPFSYLQTVWADEYKKVKSYVNRRSI